MKVRTSELSFFNFLLHDRKACIIIYPLWISHVLLYRLSITQNELLDSRTCKTGAEKERR